MDIRENKIRRQYWIAKCLIIIGLLMLAFSFFDGFLLKLHPDYQKLNKDNVIKVIKQVDKTDAEKVFYLTKILFDSQKMYDMHYKISNTIASLGFVVALGGVIITLFARIDILEFMLKDKLKFFLKNKK